MTTARLTPTVVILFGVIGRTLSYGVTGLFLGPIILAVTWELIAAWAGDDESKAFEPTPVRTAMP